MIGKKESGEQPPQTEPWAVVEERRLRRELTQVQDAINGLPPHERRAGNPKFESLRGESTDLQRALAQLLYPQLA